MEPEKFKRKMKAEGHWREPELKAAEPVSYFREDERGSVTLIEPAKGYWVDGPPEVPAEGAYWPPYDFAQGKSLEVVYTSEPVNFAVLSLEEAHEFLSNLYKEVGGKDQISDRKSQFDFASGIKSAYETARGLGGLGVTSYTKSINGKEWVIIKNYRRHKQTLMKGNKWLASNPKVVEAGIGINNIKGSMRYVKMNATVEIAFSVGINAVDYILRDEATLLEFGVNSASDFVKGMITLVAAGAVAAAFASGGILISGVVFAASSYFIGDQVSNLDKKLGVSDKFKRKVEEVLQ